MAGRAPTTFRDAADGNPCRRLDPTTLDENLRRMVKAFLAISPISDRQFGQLVLGNPNFVKSLDKGHPLTLETADRVLRFMGEPLIGPSFRREVTAFLAVTGTKGTTLGQNAAGDPSFMKRLREGKSPQLAAVQLVRAWMREAADDAERAAIDQALAAGEETEPDLSSHPAVMDPPVDGPGSSSSDRRNRPDKNSSEHDRNFFLSARQAAAFLSISARTLHRMRESGHGPPYHRFGHRLAYARADLLVWAGRGVAVSRSKSSNRPPSDLARRAYLQFIGTGSIASRKLAR